MSSAVVMLWTVMGTLSMFWTVKTVQRSSRGRGDRRTEHAGEA